MTPSDHEPHQSAETVGGHHHRDELQAVLREVTPTAREPQAISPALNIDTARANLARVTTEPLSNSETNEQLNDPLLDRAYAGFQQREAQEPRPDDYLVGITIKSENPEFQTLVDAGLNPEDVRRGHLTRQQLLDAGFFFINRLGGGEKGLISGTIPDPNQPDHALNFTNRVFLTRTELDAVYAHQQARPELFGLQGQDLDEVRKDMLSFMLAADHDPPFADGYHFAQYALPYEIESGMPGEAENSPKDWQAVNDFWNDQIKAYQSQNPGTGHFHALWAVQRAFTEQHLNDLYQWTEPKENNHFNPKTIRHQPIHFEGLREQKMQNQLSPFLTSGFRFDDRTIDMSVDLPSTHGEAKTKQVRLNTAVLHLAGAHPDYPGFSEMGGSARDQVYMPIGMYVDKLFPKDPHDRATAHQQEAIALEPSNARQIVLASQQRLIQVARQYQAQRPRGLFRRALDRVTRHR